MKLSDFTPAVQKRLVSAWNDTSVSTTDFRQRFHVGDSGMRDLRKELGQRPSAPITERRGLAPLQRLTNAWPPGTVRRKK
jgi:hypothetical protein